VVKPHVRRAAASLGLLSASIGGCSDADEGAPVTSAGGVVADRCVVRLHGKGGQGGSPTVDAGIATLSPDGNADGWGGRQWLYFPEDDYASAVEVVAQAVAATQCAEVVVAGFSNGASFAAKLYCAGETLSGTLVGVVIDDPVTDSGVAECAPSASAVAALYWTRALESVAPAGADCSAIDWTCEGGTSIGIDAYAAWLGIEPQPSIFTDHQPYWVVPEIEEWLN